MDNPIRKAFRGMLNKSFGESFLKAKEICFASEREWKEAKLIVKMVNSSFDNKQDIDIETSLDLNNLYEYCKMWAKGTEMTLYPDHIEIESNHGKRYIWHKR